MPTCPAVDELPDLVSDDSEGEEDSNGWSLVLLLQREKTRIHSLRWTRRGDHDSILFATEAWIVLGET